MGRLKEVKGIQAWDSLEGLSWLTSLKFSMMVGDRWLLYLSIMNEHCSSDSSGENGVSVIWYDEKLSVLSPPFPP